MKRNSVKIENKDKRKEESTSTPFVLKSKTCKKERRKRWQETRSKEKIKR